MFIIVSLLTSFMHSSHEENNIARSISGEIGQQSACPTEVIE